MSKTITCVDVNGKTREFPIEELSWRPSVYGIVIKDNAILLSKQFGDKYDLPGGGVDLGEKPGTAVIREIKEETGLDVKDPKLLGIENSFFWASHDADQAYQSILLYYLCEFVGGEFSIDGFDELEQKYAEMAEWVRLEKLDELKVASTVDYRPYVKKALTGN